MAKLEGRERELEIQRGQSAGGAVARAVNDDHHLTRAGHKVLLSFEGGKQPGDLGHALTCGYDHGEHRGACGAACEVGVDHYGAV
jgi:hypothetical protein